MSKIQCTIGCDPELFLRHIESGKFVSAHDLLPGTKESPFKLNRGAVQVDGTAAEINTIPTGSKLVFLDNVREVRNQIMQMLNYEYELVPQTVVRFDKDLWDSLPSEAKELGCDPDFNAYTGEENPVPNQEEDFRTGAGHIHIGWTEGVDPMEAGHFEACRVLVRYLDYMVGAPFQFFEGDNERRQLYGRAGAFRPKSYGCEYRVPSNFWLTRETLAAFVFEKTESTFRNLVSLGQDVIEEDILSEPHGSSLCSDFINGGVSQEKMRKIFEAKRPQIISMAKQLNLGGL